MIHGATMPLVAEIAVPPRLVTISLFSVPVAALKAVVLATTDKTPKFWRTRLEIVSLALSVVAAPRSIEIVSPPWMLTVAKVWADVIPAVVDPDMRM